MGRTQAKSYEGERRYTSAYQPEGYSPIWHRVTHGRGVLRRNVERQRARRMDVHMHGKHDTAFVDPLVTYPEGVWAFVGDGIRRPLAIYPSATRLRGYCRHLVDHVRQDHGVLEGGRWCMVERGQIDLTPSVPHDEMLGTSRAPVSTGFRRLCACHVEIVSLSAENRRE